MVCGAVTGAQRKGALFLKRKLSWHFWAVCAVIAVAWVKPDRAA